MKTIDQSQQLYITITFSGGTAIDFEMTVEKVPNPKGDRIEVKMSGKFLSYNQW